MVAASGLNEAAITAAATLLLPLAAFTASAALSPELQALLDAPLQDQLPTLPQPAGLELPLPAEQQWHPGGATPGPPRDGSTPFDTSLAADQLANLSHLQLPSPPPFPWAVLTSQMAQADTSQPDAMQQWQPGSNEQPGGNEQHGSAHKRQRNA